MSKISAIILSILIAMQASSFAVEDKLQENPIKLITYTDCMLWLGYGRPDKFDSSTIKDDTLKMLALGAGLNECEELAIEGDPIFIGTLAGYYYFIEKNTRKGLYWAFKGAEKGSTDSMAVLRDAYINGNGVVKDPEEGVKWMYLAAAAGDESFKERLNEIERKNPHNEALNRVRTKAKEWQKMHPEAFFSPE